MGLLLVGLATVRGGSENNHVSMRIFLFFFFKGRFFSPFGLVYTVHRYGESHDNQSIANSAFFIVFISRRSNIFFFRLCHVPAYSKNFSSNAMMSRTINDIKLHKL